MEKEKMKEAAIFLSERLKEMGEKDAFTEEKFHEQWRFYEDFFDIRYKLTGEEKHDGFGEIKRYLLEITNENYCLAGFMSVAVLSNLDEQRIDFCLEAIKNNELFIEKDEITLLENIIDTMRWKEHDVNSLEALLSLMKNNGSVTKPQLTGFSTVLTTPKIIDLYSKLQGSYVDCSETDFKAMFSDNPKPVKWTNKKALLAFFVSDIFQKENPDNYWNKAESIFVDVSNNPFTSLRQSFQTAYGNKNKEPKLYQELKNIYFHLL